MSDTPNNADEIQRLLDNGWMIGLFRNSLGSYTAYCWRGRKPATPCGLPERQITDDSTPSQALHRLAEKMIGNIV